VFCPLDLKSLVTRQMALHLALGQTGTSKCSTYFHAALGQVRISRRHERIQASFFFSSSASGTRHCAITAVWTGTLRRAETLSGQGCPCFPAQTSQCCVRAHSRGVSHRRPHLIVETKRSHRHGFQLRASSILDQGSRAVKQAITLRSFSSSNQRSMLYFSGSSNQYK
jgi:hypothetical protein